MSASGHSLPEKNYIVFSAYNGKDKQQDIIQHSELVSLLDQLKIKHKLLLGSYNGDIELSIICNAKHLKQLKDVIFVAYKQECVLLLNDYVHGLYKASLVYKNDDQEFQGYLREVPHRVALKQDSFTYDIKNNKSFIITPESTTVSCELTKLGYR